MPAYSVAAAKNGLPKLIDRALDGEEVVITRHGKPVAEVKPIVATRRTLTDAERAAMFERIRLLRETGPTLPFTAVDLLNDMYDE